MWEERDEVASRFVGYRCMGDSDIGVIWGMEEGVGGLGWVDVSVSVSVQRDGTDAFVCLPIVRRLVNRDDVR
jgi:hypothetical protein